MTDSPYLAYSLKEDKIYIVNPETCTKRDVTDTAMRFAEMHKKKQEDRL